MIIGSDCVLSVECSCYSTIHNNKPILPFAVCEYSTTYAFVVKEALLEGLKN